MKKPDINISEMIAPMFAITAEIDMTISTLLRNEFAMSMADFKILRAIHMLDTCTQLDISRFNHVTEAAVSKRVRALTQEGLITKLVSPNDKRKSILSLTAKGKIKMKQLQATVIGNTELLLSDFPESKRRLTAQLLTEALRLIMAHNLNDDKSTKSKHPVLKK